MDVVEAWGQPRFRKKATKVILLDTNAVLFLLLGDRRADRLLHQGKLCFSPISLLEMQFLAEWGRLQFEADDPAEAARADGRWTVDNVPIDTLVRHAMPLDFTRDPFDRLLVVLHSLMSLRTAADSN